MGANAFIDHSMLTDIQEAFEELKGQAFHEKGSDGYTGSIAEKTEYTVVTATPIAEAEAYALASRLLGNDRFGDKHGPAGAAAVLDTTRTWTLTVPARQAGEGYADEGQAALAAARQHPDWTDCARITGRVTGWWESDSTGLITSGTLSVTVTDLPPGHAGWIFFGTAPC